MQRLWRRVGAYGRKIPSVVWLLVFGEALEATGRNLVRPFLALYLYREGADLGAVGLVLAAGPVANLLVGLTGGSLADRCGRRPLLTLGTAGGGLALLAFALTDSPLLLGLLHFLNTAFRTLYRPASMAAFADVTPPALRPEVYGLRRVGRNSGAVIGPALGFWFFLHAPQGGFLAAGVLTLAMAWVHYRMMPETSGTPPEGAAGPPSEAGAWRTVFADRALLLFLPAGIGFTACERFFNSYFPVAMGNRLDDWVFPALLVLNAVLVLALQIPVNVWLGGRQTARVFVLGGTLWALGLAWFALPVTLVGAFAATAVLTLGEVAQKAVISLFVPTIAPPDSRGRYEGAAGLMELGGLFMPLLAGYLLPTVGQVGTVLAMAVLALGSGLVGVWAARAAAERLSVSAGSTGLRSFQQR